MCSKIVASHEAGGITFIIQPVLKAEGGFTIDEMIEHLLKREVEDNGFIPSITSTSERSKIEKG